MLKKYLFCLVFTFLTTEAIILKKPNQISINQYKKEIASQISIYKYLQYSIKGLGGASAVGALYYNKDFFTNLPTTIKNLFSPVQTATPSTNTNVTQPQPTNTYISTMKAILLHLTVAVAITKIHEKLTEIFDEFDINWILKKTETPQLFTTIKGFAVALDPNSEVFAITNKIQLNIERNLRGIHLLSQLNSFSELIALEIKAQAIRDISIAEDRFDFCLENIQDLYNQLIVAISKTIAFMQYSADEYNTLKLTQDAQKATNSATLLLNNFNSHLDKIEKVLTKIETQKSDLKQPGLLVEVFNFNNLLNDIVSTCNC